MLLALLLALLVGLAQAATSYWPTFHKDARNSGRQDFPGPRFNGTCRGWDYDEQTIGFSTTGVLSATNHRVYIPLMNNSISSVDALTGHVYSLWSGTRGFAIYGDPAVLVSPTYGEVLFVSSTDKRVYALQTTPTVSPIWVTTMPQPSFSAVRAVPDFGGLVFIGTADDVKADANGTLRVYGAWDGSFKWSYPCMSFDGTLQLGLNTMPAIDTSRNVTYLAYGDVVVALDVFTGAVLAKDNGTLADPFRSSPTVTGFYDALFVQAASGVLYRYSLIGPRSNLTVRYDWSCAYGEQTVDCCFPPWKCSFLAESLQATYTSPISTPALGPNDLDVIVGIYSPIGSPIDGGLVSAKALSGVLNWRFTGFPTLGKGSTRSSPALDADGAVFVPMQGAAGPLLYGLHPDGSFRFVAEIGQFGDQIEDASVILGTDTEGTPRIFVATDGRLSALDEGFQCPTDVPLVDCSGHGDCDCDEGVCDCDPCYMPGLNNDCSVLNTCSGRGTCFNDICTCENSCYFGNLCQYSNDCNGRGTCSDGQCHCVDLCYTGRGCELAVTCSGHGSCTSAHGCACTGGWRGMDCADTPLEPSSGGGGDGGGLPGAVVGILITIGFLAVGGAVYYFFYGPRGRFRGSSAARAPFVRKAAPAASGGTKYGGASSSYGTAKEPVYTPLEERHLKPGAVEAADAVDAAESGL